MRIDFNDLKARVPILEAAKALKLDLKESQGEVLQFRSPCPACRAGGDRALAITPSRGYFCNSDKRGGDVVALVSHIKSLSFRQAAEWLATEFRVESSVPQEAKAPTLPPVPQTQAVEAPTKGLKPLENLDGTHELSKALNLPEVVATALGAGYCKKGMMRGFVAFPLRLPDGRLIGYVGVKEGKLPIAWNV